MLTTSELVQGCLDCHNAGDPTARNRLIQHSQERLRLLVRRTLGNFPNVRRWEDTSDVFQNVVIRLDRALSRIPLGTSRDFFNLASYHTRIVLIDLSRRHRHLREAPLDYPEQADETVDPEMLTFWGEFHSFIAALPDEVREPFDLVYYQGLTQIEAAELLGVSERTLRRRWLEARLRLMDWLGDDYSW
jgi:RNA polymerase sigma-70 factor (ECF subfamily)